MFGSGGTGANRGAALEVNTVGFFDEVVCLDLSPALLESKLWLKYEIFDASVLSLIRLWTQLQY